MKDISHNVVMSEILREDPAHVAAQLNEIIWDKDESKLTITLRQMSRALDDESIVG